jgi:hypothetical protein
VIQLISNRKASPGMTGQGHSIQFIRLSWLRMSYVLAVLACALMFTCRTVRAGVVRTVAFENQHAPGTPANVTYSTFSAPTLNATGQTAFDALTDDIRWGVWSEGYGTLALVARQGNPAPGAPSGVTFSSFYSPAINDAGQTAFVAFTSDARNGLWLKGAGSASLIAREGNHAPGASGDVNFSSLQIFTPSLNADGNTAFFAFLAGSDVNFTNSYGLWLGGSGGLNLVARMGSQAAGLPSGVTYSDLEYPVPDPAPLSVSGRTAFYAYIEGSGVTTNNDRGIWSGDPGNLSLVARAGNQAPGAPSGANFYFFNDPVLNSAGQTAFWANLIGNVVDWLSDEGIWLATSGSLSSVARSGSHAPGTADGVNFYRFDYFSLVLNASGRTAFKAELIGAGVNGNNDQGIWSEGAGTLALIARQGSQAAGIATSGVNYNIFYSEVLNSAGQLAFSGTLKGSSVNTSNDIGIWATDVNGVLQLIAREGDMLEVAPSQFRTINGLEFSVGSSGNGDGRPSGFNDVGQVAFSATFTDGTSGVFVSNLVATIVPGDFNSDHNVDGDDFLAWQRGQSPNPLSSTDLAAWRTNFGAGATTPVVTAVPEPGTWPLVALALVGLLRSGRTQLACPSAHTT